MFLQWSLADYSSESEVLIDSHQSSRSSIYIHRFDSIDRRLHRLNCCHLMLKVNSQNQADNHV